MTGALAGRVVVVVGGTTGIGRSAAAACLRHGARVVVVGRDEQDGQQALESLGADARLLLGDATQAETALSAIGLAVAEFGACDAVYHVAGGSGRSFGDGPVHLLTDEGWERTLSLNLGSVFHTCRAAVGHWLSRERAGSLLLTGSVLAFAPAPEHFATHAYAAAKSGILGLARSLAATYAPRSIRVNVLAPGLVDTPMSTRACGRPEIVDYVSRRQPLDGGRVGVPADLDEAAVYFLSDHSRFVTGQVLAVDGGWSLTSG